MECADDGMDCREVLDQVYEYLDGELDADAVAAVKSHLDACSHCLREFGLEDAIRHLVAKSCGCQTAPTGLRNQILTRITEVRMSGADVSYRSTTINVERQS
ncbi:MAG: mycothiol system anti-sigma-R factor [Actinobacteria bacterium]|nr:mycothiol system anti-sigma-R factor [Actinomycetota bacterium]